MTTQHRPIATIENDLRAATAKRDNYRQTINDGQGGYVDESDIVRLADELTAAHYAASPLLRDLAGEKAWFNGQGFRDPQRANKACLARGYSLAELQAASKAAK